MPTATEYSQAIQNLGITTRDEELQAGEVAVDPLGLPLQYSGNFAVVYQVHCPQTGNDWAVKCFTKDVAGRRDRYRGISEHLQRRRLSFMVDFQYQESGILIGSQWHPLLKMRWVEGAPLNRFVANHLDKPSRLRQLLGLWVKLAQRLRRAAVTHADLQHGNVLLVSTPDGEKQRLMLVDYDGLYVPSLADRPSGELGHRSYQHPQRRHEGTYSADVDDFSHLAIYCAVRALMAGRRKLWERFDNGDNLLFREPDFTAPDQSELFQRLWRARNEDLRALVGYLILATKQPLDQVPLLDDILSDGQVRPLDSQQEQHLSRLMGDRPAVRGPTEVRQQPPATEVVSKPEETGLHGEDATDALENMVGEWLDEEALSQQDQVVDVLPTTTNSIGMKLALIPAGEFLMGSPASVRSASADEKPRHPVRITRPFYLGVYEVTQGEYVRVMGTNPSRFKGDHRLPVEQVSWQEAMTFCERLSALPAERSAGRLYRLPTEAEWEYACRAGSTTIYSFGDSHGWHPNYAWYDSNSGRKTHPVGRKHPNAWGLYDMYGNVWEWCSDWYDDSYYANSPVDDPPGVAAGSDRVIRGGGWNRTAWSCRSACRRRLGPGCRSLNLGFRVAFSSVDQSGK